MVGCSLLGYELHSPHLNREPILLASDPVDVAHMSQVARFFYDIIYGPGSQRLWRELCFEQPLDDLRTCVSPLGRLVGDTDWRAHLQRTIHARIAVERYTQLDSDERVRVLKSLIHLATHVTPRQQPDSDDISDNHVWLVTFLKDTSLFDSDEIPGPTASEEEVQQQITERAATIAKDPADIQAAMKLVYGQYMLSLHFLRENTLENAKRLGYLDARELYPDIPAQSLEEFAKEFYSMPDPGQILNRE